MLSGLAKEPELQENKTSGVLLCNCAEFYHYNSILVSVSGKTEPG